MILARMRRNRSGWSSKSRAAVKRLGMRRWRALHLTGLWVVFGIFANSYFGRAFSNPSYAAPAALLAAALIVRLLPTRAGSRSG